MPLSPRLWFLLNYVHFKNHTKHESLILRKLFVARVNLCSNRNGKEREIIIWKSASSESVPNLPKS